MYALNQRTTQAENHSQTRTQARPLRLRGHADELTTERESGPSSAAQWVHPVGLTDDQPDTRPTPDECVADDQSPEGAAHESTSPASRSTPGASGKAGFDRKQTGHGMLNAGQFANRRWIALRHVLLRLVSLLPGTRFKTRLIRRLFGMTIGEDVGLAYRVMFDPYDPTMISIGDNVLIGIETRIFVHTFMLNRQRVRPVTIGSNVQIGAFCVIAPGVTIGDGASIGPCTLVSRNVPPGAIVTGNEMRIRRRKR